MFSKILLKLSQPIKPIGNECINESINADFVKVNWPVNNRINYRKEVRISIKHMTNVYVSTIV